MAILLDIEPPVAIRSHEVPLLKTLSFIGASDQLAAAVEQLRSQIAYAEICAASIEERAQCVEVQCIIEGLEATLNSIDDLLAFERNWPAQDLIDLIDLTNFVKGKWEI